MDLRDPGIQCLKPAAEDPDVKRLLVVAGCGIAVFASYLVVILGVADSSQVGPLKVAGIALPGLVTGLAMAAYITWESRNAREAQQRTEDLSAQLIRKEIEIGRLATVDELTGLYTRREFDETLRLECARSRRHGRDLALLLLEIDDIAELGDHVGKLNKGYLLAEMSGILKHLLRTNDIGCRYTAESLALLLPETNAAQCRIVTGKIRKAMAEHEFLGGMQQKGVRLTVSQGVAVVGSAVDDHMTLVHAAEQTLCEARALGFDQVKIVEVPPADSTGAAA